MAQFILLYTTGPAKQPPQLSEEDFQNVISEYIAWGDKLRAEGRVAGGARLTSVWTDPGRVARTSDRSSWRPTARWPRPRRSSAVTASSRPPTTMKLWSLCRSHPHLKEGRIVIRQLA